MPQIDLERFGGVSNVAPPLICVRVRGDAICGNDSTEVNAVLINGRYIVRPQCLDCAKESARAQGLIE